jgi:hypothetical protein
MHELSAATTPARAPADRAAAPAPAGGLPTASPAQAHQLAPTARRGRREGDHLGTTRRDVLLDPRKARGEGLAVTSSEAGSSSTDGVSSTIMYFQALQENPTATEAELWTAATRRDYNYGGAVTTFQQPRTAAAPSLGAPAGQRGGAAFGAMPPPDLVAPRDNTRVADPRRAPKQRHAVVIGNAAYRGNLNPLPGAQRDASLMASRYEGRGYAVSHLEDLSTVETERAIRGVGESARSGDELAIYFAGHGVGGDLTGVDSVIGGGQVRPRVPAAVPSGALGKALSAGAKLELVIDACESGPLQQQLGRDLDGLGSAQAVDAQGITARELRAQKIAVSGETTGIAPIRVPNAGDAFDRAFAPSRDGAQLHARNAAIDEQRRRDRAARAAAAQAGGKPSGLGGAVKGQ